jgi:3-oxoadipate enol-lactonase
MTYDDIGTGEPLVLIHGLAASRKYWSPQHELASHYRLIVPDLPGHGSNTFTHAISISSFARHVIEILDELGIESAHVCGHSLGGVVAQEIYRQARHRVRSLILANTFSYCPPFIGELAMRDLIYRLKHMTETEYIDDVIRRDVHIADSRVIDIAKSLFHVRKDVVIRAARSAVNANYWSMLPLIRVPVLIVGSEYDNVTPIYAARFTHYWTRGARLEVMDTGHLSNVEDTQRWNDVVREFLGEVG